MFTNLNRHLAFFVLTLTCLAGRAQVLAAENMQMSPAVPDSSVAVTPDGGAPAADSTLRALPDSSALALPDSSITRDSLLLTAPDSVLVDSTISPNAITDPVDTHSADSTTYLLGEENRVLLYGNAKVTFQDMEITGDYINFNLDTKVAFARGTYDTATHEVKGKPVFKQGSETFEMDSMYFNFTSKKAKIYAVITQQSDGYLHGEEIKRMPDNVIYVAQGKFTACDDEHPHYYLKLTKAKVIPNDRTIAGPAYFVLLDVPTPLFIPFFITPKTASRASGVIIPSYGEETNRGFYFREGGYYFAINDYCDVTVTGDIFTLGSWRLSSRAAYLWKYHFSGGFNVNYAYNVVGEPGSPDYNPSTAFSLQWNHSQDPKFSPNKTFSASVNFTSSSYRRYNETSLNESLTNTTQSSVSYSQVWPGTPFSMSIAGTHSHNTRDSIITLGLPTVTLNMARITPFKRKERVGPIRWYENIGIPLSVSMQNTLSAKETEFDNMDALVRRMRNGARYNTSLSVPFTVAKFINLTPSISYNGRMYLSHINQKWVDTAGRAGYVRRDTIYGFSHDYDFSTSASTSTMIYGMFMLGKWSPVQAVRHVISPSVSIGWRPDFSDPMWGIYRDVQVDSTGRTQRYSQHQNGIYGTAGSGKNASLSFGLGNTLEMKVRSKSDTTGTGSKKVKLLEALNFSASYNLLADSMKLSNIGFSGRTTLLGVLGISFNGVLNPYALDSSSGRVTKYWNYSRAGSLARLTSFGFSFGYSFNRSEKVTNTLPHPVVSDLDPMGEYDGIQVSYVDFTLPWSLNFNYSFSYSKPALVPNIVQTLNFNGSFSLTPQWAFTFQSGYDLDRRQIAPTSVSLNRDLHCWMFSFSWVPIGSWKSWNFTINAKSSMLRDLKYDRRQSRFDQQPIE